MALMAWRVRSMNPVFVVVWVKLLWTLPSMLKMMLGLCILVLWRIEKLHFWVR